jgi:cell division protease FtsH
VLLAGRAAEHLAFGHLSTGAADDLAKATDIARSMVTRYGMDEGLGHATYETERPTFLGMPSLGEPRNLSEDTTRRIDAATRLIVNGAFERATRLLEQHRAVLDAGARQLLEQETLDQADLQALKSQLSLAAVSAMRS